MGEQYNELAALLRTVRNRWRAMTAMRAWSWAAAAAAAVLALALLAYRLTAPEGLALVMLWGAATVAMLACLGWIVRPLRRMPGDRQVARLVEECCPELEDTLITVVAEHEAESPRPMLAAVIADALRRARCVDLDRVISRRALRRAAMSAAAATVALFVLGVFSAGPAGRAARVFAIYVFPERVVLHVLPGDVRLRAGQPLRIVARIPGLAGGVVPVLRYGDGKRWREARMEPEQSGQSFAFGFDRVEQGFKYAVAAAAARSREYDVTVVRPPRVERIDLRYQYPAAFGLQPRVEEDSGDIYGPAGTRVRVSIQADKPITSASLNLAGGQKIALHGSGARAEGDLVIGEDGSYRVALTDADGLDNPGDTEYFIRTLEDRPPDVRVIRPAGDREVTPIEEVSIEARADDDFGVASFDLVYSVRGGVEKAVPFRRDGSGMTVNGERTVYLEDLSVQPGDFVTYYARARDISRGKRSSEARSDIFFLEVKPFEEEFVAAESQAMGGGQGDRSLDDLAAAQKEIIVATWKLDARARNTRARSEEDIRNVARAQAELRKRAQGAAGQLQRALMDPRRRRVPRPAGPTPGDESPTDDPMTKAVEAMGRAAQQLEALKTSEALPHEMAALNELLRAQAEVRKRQVQRQQAQSGGGRFQNRQQQDLSSLFDRELARQQTNYETPSSSETREDKADDNGALEKIRELARRQEALNREQEELARRRDQMTEEELRRQLEKLTREQSELRRQAEELSRQMQQQGQQAGRSQNQQGQQSQQSQGQSRSQNGGGQSSQQQDAGRALGQISEEMQSATSDLRRQDPKQASARGSRALDRLRELEQRMRSSQPDDRHRAMGELQLESRQLADAQRQLANERQRQGQGGTTSDAARRRGAEQERLADRMQRLEQAVKQMAGAQGAADDQRRVMQEAARDLDRQKLAERMRKAARAERAAAESESTSAQEDGRQGSSEARQATGQENAKQEGQQAQQGAASERRAGAREGEEIARALERLAEKLGAANGQTPEARRLSDQLARMRDLRERLGEVDRQLEQMRRNGGERQQASESNQQAQRGGDPQQRGGDERQASSEGRQGQSGQQGPADGGRGGEISRPQDARPWEQTRDLIEELRRQQSGLGLNTPEMNRFNPGLSAPGTEAWKQDFAKWDELKKQIALALEKAETSAASQLREQQSKDRLNAGGTQAVPEQYRRLVDKYYRALAQKKKP